MSKRTVWAEHLGLWNFHDTLHEALWDREGARGTAECALGAEEVWDYDGVARGWCEFLREQLAVHGLHYDLEEDLVTLPASVEAGSARRICRTLMDEHFVHWIAGVVAETREGKPDPRKWDVRADDDRGGRWVRMAQD
ncbi:hypothetical protein ACH4PU_30930 [Streptomyces sp. NPDC021100]|uniref:hypothetical protein n=1 Tax=Streptomyces sp. NPDC021100 TaxID=3365114 RepID=UPI0037A5ED50